MSEIPKSPRFFGWLRKSGLMKVGKRAGFAAGVLGAMADFASPLADFSGMLALMTLMGTLFLGCFWFGKKRKELVSVSREEGKDTAFINLKIEENLWGKGFVTCMVATLVFAFFYSARAWAGGEKEGLLASSFPAITELQNSVFRLERIAKNMDKKLDDLKKTVDANSNQYPMEALLALEKNGEWGELAKHLKDIDPLKREGAWQALLERASVGALSQWKNTHTELETYELATKLGRDFPTLRNHAKFLKVRAEVGLKGFESCLQTVRAPAKTAAAQPGQNRDTRMADFRARGRQENADREQKWADCQKPMLKFVEYDKENHTLAYEAGKMVQPHLTHRNALPFFKLSLENGGSEKVCQSQPLKRAVMEGLGHRFERHHELAHEIAQNHCFSQLKETFLKRLGTPGVYPERKVASICEAFKKNGEAPKIPEGEINPCKSNSLKAKLKRRNEQGKD